MKKVYRNLKSKIKIESLEKRGCISCKYSADIFQYSKEFSGNDFICDKLKVDKVFNKNFYCCEFETKV